MISLVVCIDPRMALGMLISVAVLSHGLSDACHAASGSDAPITITITRPQYHADLSRIPVNVYTIDGTRLEENPAASVQSVLSSVPGIFVDRTGTRGGQGSIYLRGSDPNLTAVRIDGVQVNDPTNSRGGSFDLTTVNASEVEHIAVLSGPLSTLYGSDAMAGVIDIRTKRESAVDYLDLEAGLGEAGYSRLAIHSAGPLGEDSSRYYSMAAGYVDAGEPIEGDTYLDRSASGKISFVLGNDSRLDTGIRFKSFDSTSFPDDSGGPEFAVDRRLDAGDGARSIMHLHYERSGSDRHFNVNASRYETNEFIRSPGVAPGTRDPFGIPENSSDNEFIRYQFAANATVSFNDRVTTTLGAEFQRESGGSRGLINAPGGALPTSFGLERSTISAVGGLRYRSTDLVTIHGGVRLIKPGGFETELIPIAGIVYEPEGVPVAFKINFSEGFKLPSFFALGSPLVGNPDLRPESSESVEMGAVYRLRRSVIAVTAYRTEYQGLVDLELDPRPRLVNRSRVVARGAELAFGTQFGWGMKAKLYLAITETDIRDSDAVLRNRPRHRAGLHLNWQAVQDLALGTDLTYVSERLDSSIPTGDRELDPYLRADLTARWDINEWSSVSLSVENVFEADFEEAVGFPAPSRRISMFFRLATPGVGS